MITGCLSLSLCTVVLRRFVDSVTGRIPTIPVSSTPNTTALLIFSGALYYLYNNLRKGTLVRIGQGRSNNSIKASSQPLLQRGSKNKSWFLKNLWGKRKNCTDAICRLAKQSFESATNLNPCLLLPRKNFFISFSDSANSVEMISNEREQNSCEVISNNEVVQKDSDHDIEVVGELPEIKNVVTPKNIQNLERKKGKVPIVKRLLNKRKNKESIWPNHSHKFQLEQGRRTRSGKVYNPLE